MVKRKPGLRECIELAYNHLSKETGLENVKPSLKEKFEPLQKAHDSIHQFMLMAPRLFPFKTYKKVTWQSKSAFLTYHYEAFDVAHRSFIEALCGYYSVAFALLRMVLELILKGAFWECLAHKPFQENSYILDKDKHGRKIKEWLNAIFKQAPSVKEDLEKTSGAIYDKISPIVDDPDFRPSMKTIIRQLNHWGILDSVPDPVDMIYNRLYRRLSTNVHVVPDMTDIGSRLLVKPDEIFSSGEILENKLSEYALLLHEVMDIAVVVELNIMKHHIEKYEEVKTNLWKEFSALKDLGLRYSIKRMRELVR